MTFQVFRRLIVSASLNRTQAAQFIGALTMIWAIMCLPIPFFEERGYSLTTVSARDEGLGEFKNASILLVAFVLLAINWHQQVLLNGVTLRERVGSRLFGYGIRWLGYLLIATALFLGMFAALYVALEQPAADGVRDELGIGLLFALFVVSVIILSLFFRGWTGLVAIAVNEPKVGIFASWRNTKPFRFEALLLAALLVLLYFGQGQLDDFLLGLKLNGDTPEGLIEWGALFFWGLVWSFPAAIVLWLEVAILTEFYAASVASKSVREND
ncbi:hypothetical protein [uncultured Aliiroseovarius sp.]|uniref:hypothetical protein n=1 Tax=uncultured Aliiroseovarius sp. TaxID=1658783 RepID=UPI002620A2A8|nr:hypothetical protein [uncultured Aliiroseovarius sp.]